VSRLARVLLLVAFAGCSTGDALMVSNARKKLIGLTADELRLCAGIADREAETSRAVFWTYDRTAPSSSISGAIPTMGLGMSLSGSGDCRVTFELVSGQVARVGVSAARDSGPLTDAACAPVVRGCMRMLEEGSIRGRATSAQTPD